MNLVTKIFIFWEEFSMQVNKSKKNELTIGQIIISELKK